MASISYPPYRELSKEFLEPYNTFVDEEAPFINNVIKPNAVSLAKEYVEKSKEISVGSLTDPNGSSTTVKDPTTAVSSETNTSLVLDSCGSSSIVNPSFSSTQLPVQCYDPMYSNFLANAFQWSIEFSNEVRRLRGELIDNLSSSASTSPDASSSSSSSSSSSFLSSCRLRYAVPSDVSTIMGFIRELATFEREPEAVINNEELLLRDGFTPGRLFYCFLVEIPFPLYSEHMKGTNTPIPEHIQRASPPWVPISFAFVHAIYSTWQGKSLYLEDLYVSPIFRRKGISFLCFEAISRVGVITKSARFQWSALNWNTPAINAYVGPRIKAEHLDEWNLYRLYRDGIERVAKLSCH